MELKLPPKLKKALEREASDTQRDLHAHIVSKLEGITPPTEYIDPEVIVKGLPKLVEFLEKIPAVQMLSSGSTTDAYWWVKLNINIEHPLAWNVVQELGFVLNYISIEDRLPTVFM